MVACTFFGHHDCPMDRKAALSKAILEMVQNHGVNQFYIGHNGRFDRIARFALCEISERIPTIRFNIVLAYMPQQLSDFEKEFIPHTFLPDGIEHVPKRFAINYRNQWMLDHSKYVITYIDHPWGGAAQFAAKAEKQNKYIVNLALSRLQQHE